MYTTCIYCHGDLKQNEVIEEFPVGRRLAFDGAKGRLWVVCRRCERWNLSPLDTRWEAIEACERAFETTRMKVASDNIGLAKLKEGLELVRVGDPVRQEFAAWRYGDQFGRRRKRAMLVTGAVATATGALVVGGAISLPTLWLTSRWSKTWYLNRVIHRTRDSRGEPVRILRRHLYTSRLVPDAEGSGWGLHVDHVRGWDKQSGRALRTMSVHGRDAIGLAGQLMALANRRGGAEHVIRRAVRRIESAGHPEVFLPEAADLAQRAFSRAAKDLPPRHRIERLRKPLPGTLAGMSDSMRLAVEMATQEETEREALEGELKELEARWREAEEIAHIADNLFVPESVDSLIAEERERIDADPVNPSRDA
ncbi:hypothetical protein [Candidatus Palauibacter sp.]|uniref:hypothetical protein n=1 Tax=Candidatus Palauibacter sp. TaxID=3101350 RepID=UPI003B52FC25